MIGLLLAEAYLHQGDCTRARTFVEGILAASRDFGYRHLEGVAERLLGEAVSAGDRAAAGEHLMRAERIAEETGAANEAAKTLMARADLSRRDGDYAAARRLAERALVAFETLGTVDEVARVRESLNELAAAAGAQP